VDGITTVIADSCDFDFGDEVCPEYNYSFPSSPKKMLDSESANYLYKPVAIAGISTGNWGGIRAIESLVPTLRRLGMVTMYNDIHFPNVQDIFDEQGNITNDRHHARVTRMMGALVWMTKVMKYGWENIQNQEK